MREEYRKNLNRIADLQERRLLREILDGVLEELLSYDEAMFQKIEERVFGEMEYQEMNYSVVTSITSLDRYDPIHEYLFPMEAEDVKGEHAKLAVQVSPKNGQLCLEKLFLECDVLTIQDILKRDSSYSGMLFTDLGEHKILVKLCRNTEYLSKIALLYDTFQKNGIPWVTVYCPYLFKFVDVMLTECQPKMQQEEVCQRIEVSFGELEPYIRRNQIPLWNIDCYQAQTMMFPVPILDGVNYEHLIPVKKNSINCGYLVVIPEGFSCYMKQNRETLIITAPVDTMQKWELMRIVPVKEKGEQSRYPLMKNSAKDSFLNRLERNGKFFIRTEGELMRLLDSFEVSQGLELVEVQIGEKPPEHPETYSMNFFLTDGIREERYKKCMRLLFQRKGETSFLDFDRISFLVSEAQRAFPEYFCVGQFQEEIR